MRQALVSLVALVFATSLYAHRDGGVNMSISFDDEGNAADCSGLRVRIGGERAAVVSEDIPFHGSALKISAEHGHGGIRVIGNRGGSYRVSLCKAVAPGADAAGIRAVLAGNEISAQGPENEKWVAYFIVSAPRGASLDLRSTNGPISVSDFNGTLEAEAVNGPVSVKESSGTITARTTNGPVSIKGGSGEVKLQATNGPVSVKLDGTTWDGTLDASTRNGPVTLAMPRGFRSGVLVEASGGPVSCRGEACSGQRYNRFEDDDHGRLRRLEFGSGPQVVRLSTVNGPVTVRENE
ncbi:MAG TPA: hypothetical protein VF057_00290 [Thermoanaerobaculia bacterium]